MEHARTNLCSDITFGHF